MADPVDLSPRPATARAAQIDWLAYLAHERRASPRTLESYGAVVSNLVSFLEQHRGETLTLEGCAVLRAADFRAWLAFRRTGDHPLSARSLSHALSAARAFFRYLDRRLGVENSELALVRGPKVRPTLPRPVSEDSARDLLAEAAADEERPAWARARAPKTYQTSWTTRTSCWGRRGRGRRQRRTPTPTRARRRVRRRKASK
jgi:integrase/recombinase XerC